MRMEFKQRLCFPGKMVLLPKTKVKCPKEMARCLLNKAFFKGKNNVNDIIIDMMYSIEKSKSSTTKTRVTAHMGEMVRITEDLSTSVICPGENPDDNKGNKCYHSDSGEPSYAYKMERLYLPIHPTRHFQFSSIKLELRWHVYGTLHRKTGPAIEITHSDWGNERKEELYFYFDKLHRENDLPAVVCGPKQEWWIHGHRHRESIDLETGEDLPAFISDGIKKWYRFSNLHRENDLPAVIYGERKEWWSHGKLHRDTQDADGNVLPAIVDGNGTTLQTVREWHKEGKKHREGGLPAFTIHSLVEGKEVIKEAEWHFEGSFLLRASLTIVSKNETIDWNKAFVLYQSAFSI